MHDTNKPEAAGQAPVHVTISKDDLSELGTGTVGYIRAVKASELSALFPEIPPIEDNVTLWALLNADGTPILVADSREAALANAFEQELKMASVH
ncbi:hypothetical protein JM93_02400 [Roseibium hamelinense]|uniref:DUF1150 family protein n=1 Tax=Roseibium hamelinense TaxID=150831 RepID=A0A562T0T3_9HYPH|nr:DUF1150 domain-containing protein [Roseibium hamelinense]MTI42082.1 DUF1150 domain-containing protein [Roseibium hamelinense]TWI87161.1 hypothetical protein JM93_02400 [Roseibium hamelinense]